MEYTKKQWLEELKNRFGKDTNTWAFECPACKKVSTVKDFIDAGADSNSAYVDCIGRHNGKGTFERDSRYGCNWAAYGLFGHMGKGDEVIADDGKKVEVFKMADVKKD